MDTVRLYLVAPVRRDLKAMPSWRGLRKEAAEEFSRRSKK